MAASTPTPLVRVACALGMLLPGALASDDGGPASATPGGPRLAGREYRRVEVQGNEYTTSTQEACALDQDAAGRTVLVWQSKRQEADGSYGIYARRFDAGGRPLGVEHHVNLHEAGAQSRPAVALEASGAAWVVWESYGQDGSLGGIVVRRLEPGLEQGSNECLVNDVEGDEGAGRSGHQAEPALALDGEGRALVVWTSPGEAGGRVVLARRMGADGAPGGPVLRVDEAEGGRNNLPCVVVEEDGAFAVAWARTSFEGVPEGIYGRRFAADGSPLGGELELSRGVEGLPVEPALARGPDGRLLVAWLAARGEGYVPVLRLVQVDGDGWQAGEARVLETGTPGYTSGLAVQLAADGRVLAAWGSYGDEPRHHAGLWGRFLDGELEPLDEPFRVTGVTHGHQRLTPASSARHVVLADDGRLAFGWDGAGAGGDASGANLTLLVPADLEPPVLVAEAQPAQELPETPAEGAAPHEPPVFSGGSVDRSAFLTENLGGPDFGFLGITQTNLTPPDPHLAVGPDHVVQVTNGAIAWFTKDGTFQQQFDSAGGNGFWASVGANGFIFDPEVLFDPHSNRFIAMFNERSGDPYFLVAVSDDSNPNGTWHKYRFNVRNESGDTDIDSPNMGVDDTALYLAADFFGPDKYLIYMVDKAPLLTGAPNPTTTSILITGEQSMGLPVTYDAGAPAQYVIEAFENASNTQIRFHAIQSPLANPTRQEVIVNVPTYIQPEDPPQLGTSSRPQTFESRFWSCVYRDGSLWATHHTGNTRILQRWYEFDMNGWPNSGQNPFLVQSGDVDPGAGIRTFFGSIWADEDGNAGVIFARSSPSERITMGRTFRCASDPLGTMAPMQIMQSSTVPDTSGRWGDYSGVASDPAGPGVFWGSHEYRTGNGWSTWIGLMGPCKPPVVYCTAKVTSLGQTPAIGWTGEPSLTANNFAVTMINGPPGKNGVLFYGLKPLAVPFQGGIRCAKQPLKRTGVFSLDGAGSVSRPVNVTLEDLGQRRFYQFWFRDPAQPDGTTSGLSDALEVLLCP